MIIQIANIAPEGIELDFNQKEGWLREKLAQSLGEMYHPQDPVSGHLSLHKTNQNISLKIKLQLPLHPVCHRCLQSYDTSEKFGLERHLLPLFESSRERRIRKTEEVELAAEDLNVGYYEEEEIDVGEMMMEQILLDLPIIFLCNPECKGLCPSCGVNLNQIKKHLCRDRSRPVPTKTFQDSPFGVLKKWKNRN